jgi:hypothetical protein
VCDQPLYGNHTTCNASLTGEATKSKRSSAAFDAASISTIAGPTRNCDALCDFLNAERGFGRAAGPGPSNVDLLWQK